MQKRCRDVFCGVLKTGGARHGKGRVTGTKIENRAAERKQLERYRHVYYGGSAQMCQGGTT